jgi:hemolysin activation/secretion protein
MPETSPALFKRRLIAVALLVWSNSALSQLGQQFPGAGEQLRQIPPAPVFQRPLPDIRIDKGPPPPGPAVAERPFLVQSLRVTGQTVYSEAELIAIAGFVRGGEQTLTQLRAMAARIADHYHKNGYFVAQAYLPAQDIKDGAVNIVVLEGRYGSVTLNNTARIPDSLANGLLSGLNRGDTIVIAPLEERLLLLSDLPGVYVRSTLAPGSEIGTSDLNVDVTPGQAVTGTFEADNAGNRYTGSKRVGASLNINNPLGLGDVAGLRVLTSGEGLKYGRAFYQAQVGRATVGVAYSALKYNLLKEFEDLDAHGNAQVASIYASYPLIRSRNTNLYALIGGDIRTFEDKVDATVPKTVVHRNAHVLMGSLYGNHRDGFAGGGLNTFGLTWSLGNLDIETGWARSLDAATAKTDGHYGKLAYNASRLQTVTDNISLYGAINGQWASQNLDISEKLGLGGLYGVRAYPVGEAYGDKGFIVNLEARLRLPTPVSVPGQVSLVGFFDIGKMKLYEDPWASFDNHRTLKGAGVGATWMDYNKFSLSTYYAWKVGHEDAISAPDKNGRFWVSGVLFF